MILTLDAKRRLTLPASLITAQPGDHFRAEFDPEEDVLSQPVSDGAIVAGMADAVSQLVDSIALAVKWLPPQNNMHGAAPGIFR